MAMGAFVAMMTAMMLPAAMPAVVRAIHDGGSARTMPLFIGSYLAVWALASVVLYTAYRPHNAIDTALVAIAAGVYELTPLKRYFRRHCRGVVRSGIQLGICCAGSCLGLMLLLVAIDVMNVAWMAAIGAVILSQRLLPAKAAIDVPLGLAIVALGVLFAVAPPAIPGSMPNM